MDKLKLSDEEIIVLLECFLYIIHTNKIFDVLFKNKEHVDVAYNLAKKT